MNKKNVLVARCDYMVLLQVLPDYMAGYLLATHGRSCGDAQVKFRNAVFLSYFCCCVLFFSFILVDVSSEQARSPSRLSHCIVGQTIAIPST